MRAWWATVASVVKVRRRLRAGYRGALRQAVKRDRERLEKEYQHKLFDLRVRERELEDEHGRLLDTLYSLGGVQVRDYLLDKTYTASVTLNHALLVRAKDVNTLVYHLSERMGKEVQRAVLDLFVNKGKTEGAAK